MTSKIEESMRRPDWQPGIPLTLLNGEEFHFRPPVVRIWRQYEPGGSFLYENRTDLGTEYDVRLNDAESLQVQGKNIFDHIYHFADSMLMRNYREELRQHYGEILYFTNEQPVVDMWWKIYDLARGMVPKGDTSIGSRTPS
jgi:hypothetical protein